MAGLLSPYGRLTEIVVGDRVKWLWEVTCCHFILSLHSAGGGSWAMTGCCDNVWDLLTSVNDPDHYIRMDYVGHPDVSWKSSGCFMLISVVWPSLRQVGYEGASCVSGWGDPDGVIRMVCVLRVTMRCVARVLRRRGPYSDVVTSLILWIYWKNTSEYFDIKYGWCKN